MNQDATSFRDLSDWAESDYGLIMWAVGVSVVVAPIAALWWWA